MERLLIPAEAAPYVAALRSLIRTGVMAAPSLYSSCLLDLPVVISVAGQDASVERRAHIFVELLQRIVNTRLSGMDVSTASILFGLAGNSGRPAQDRYRTVAQLYNSHWTWENYRKEPLTRHLLAVSYALQRESEMVGDEPHVANPPDALNGLIGQDWALDEYAGVFTLPAKPGDKLVALQTRTVRCLAKQAQVLRYRLRWRERGNSELPIITVQGKGSIKIVESFLIESTNVRVLISDITFDKPLHYGESITFPLLTQLPVEFDKYKSHTHDWYGMLPTSRMTRHIKVGVHIPESLTPTAIWKQEHIVDGFSKPGTPDPSTVLQLDGNNYVETEWFDAPAGNSYGISLEW